MNAAAAAVVKAAIPALTDENTRKKIGWVLAAILSPAILLIAFLRTLDSGTASHNLSVVELYFYGGMISSETPDEYRAYIEEMRAGFNLLGGPTGNINELIEGEDGSDETRVKALFYILYLGADSPGQRDCWRFTDCFVAYGERTRTVTVKHEDGTNIEEEETYTVAVFIKDLEAVYENLHVAMGVEITEDQRSNAESIYSLIRYGYTGGSSSLEGANVPFIGADGFCSPIGENWWNVVISEFGDRIDPTTGEWGGHTGMDLAVPVGTPIHAALSGTVTVSIYSRGEYGHHIMIDHGNGLPTLYGHRSQLLASVGRTAKAGNVTALSGSTGRSASPHLHFEVRISGQRINPHSYLPQGRGKEIIIRIKANLLNKLANLQMDDCQIEKVVELPRDQLSVLVIIPLTNQPFTMENRRWMFAGNSVVHCLSVLGQGSDDGVLIYSGSYDYPRLAAYLPGMRDILNVRPEQAMDFIVHQGTEVTENGSWSISCEELEKQTGTTARRGNGLDGMLLEALMRRGEAASVSMTNTGIDMAYHLNLCPRILSQKPYYFIELPEEQETQVFYEAIEVLFDFFDDENLYDVLHNGLRIPNEKILAHGYLTTEAILAASAVMVLPEDSDIFLWDVLQYELAEELSLVHARGGEPVPLEQEEELTRTERKQFSGALDAHVLESRVGEHGTELVIGGVKPERPERFRSIFDAYKSEDQSTETIQ